MDDFEITINGRRRFDTEFFEAMRLHEVKPREKGPKWRAYTTLYKSWWPDMPKFIQSMTMTVNGVIIQRLKKDKTGEFICNTDGKAEVFTEVYLWKDIE